MLRRWLIVPLILLASPAVGVTYYVRTDGNDACDGLADAGGSSGSCAFRTILKGLQAAQAGETVIVHSGSYTGETLASQRSGSSGNLITLQAVAGETVSISRITISHDYNVVQGFRITASGPYWIPGMAISGSYNQALDNTFIGTCQPWLGGEGACMAMSVSGSNNTISNNIFDGTDNSTNSFGICIWMTGSNNQIIHNLFVDINSPGRLFEIYGTYHTISHNEVRNIRNDYENDEVHVDIFQGFNSSSHDIVVEGNYFHDCRSQFVMFADWQVPGAIHHWTFRNNVWANISSSAFIKSKDIYFYNNTFYRVGQVGNNAIIYSIDSEGDGSNGRFINNILIPNATNTSMGLATANTTHNNNYYGTTAFGPRSVSETGMVNGGDPLFIGAFSDCTANACDFHIGADSVARDRGATLSGFAADRDGSARPQGPAWDIGAYEFVGRRPQAPSNLRVE